MSDLEAVEICAGAGGQVLGLELAGFRHKLAVELDENACNTLRRNLSVRNSESSWEVRQGDVADPEVWKPSDYQGIDLFAGGVPCPPFSIAGKQLGASDERDLFAWAVEQVSIIQPRALLLENVRGLSMPRFAGYRQHVLDRLREFGYIAEWRLLQASDYGVPQLRPRFVLVALQEEYAPFFHWPEKVGSPPHVGPTLVDLMGSGGWEGALEWSQKANDIAPTIVGGSKKHGGADLGPTRAKRAWEALGVDAHGLADAPPPKKPEFKRGMPRLTCEMVALIQGFQAEWNWEFTGRKTSMYRQVGNAFPPPVAKAVGQAIAAALRVEGAPRVRDFDTVHDPIYRALQGSRRFMNHAQLCGAAGLKLEPHELEQKIALLSRDFEIETRQDEDAVAYKLGAFKAFIGQADHERHEQFLKSLARIS